MSICDAEGGHERRERAHAHLASILGEPAMSKACDTHAGDNGRNVQPMHRTDQEVVSEYQQAGGDRCGRCVDVAKGHEISSCRNAIVKLVRSNWKAIAKHARPL